MRQGWFGGRGRLVAVVSGLVTAAGLVAALVLVAADRLPGFLVATAAWVMPEYRVRIGDAQLRGLERLDVRHVRVFARDTGELLLAAKRFRFQFSPWAIRQGRLAEVRVVGPLVLVPDELSPGDGSSSAAGPPPDWTVDRLIIRGGRVHASPRPDRPGLAFRFATDLRELGLRGERGGRSHRLRVRDLRATLAHGPPNLVVQDALVTVRPAAVLERRTVDEIRLFGLALSLPPMAATGAPTGGEPSVPAVDWRIDRFVTRGAQVDVPPAGDRPGVALTFAFDLSELGLQPPLNERVHRVRLRNLRMTLGDRPPSLVVDAGRTEFTLADLLTQQRLARLAIEGGTLVVDSALRARLAGQSGSGPPGVASRASLGVLEIRQLGLRIAELAPGVPDITLTFETTLREVPLSPEALALARDPQRVELADLRLYSPLDPFRQVVRVGSVFVDFTLGDILRQRIESLTILSPTIYIGEDLIWYMNMARRQETAAAGAPKAPPWTVGRARADLGKIVVTFNGVDRLSLPITFQTQARNVALENIAALRLSAALQVPRQSYTFPGFDVALVDMEGKLYFHYPPGEARDNVVNVLEVREMRWRDYRLTKGWLAVTFDEGGINGKLGGQAYEGYVDGGLSVPFGAGPPWSGWMAGTKLDLAPIAEVVAGSGVQMTGIADVRGAADLRAGQRLERAEGELKLEGPGEIRFPALDTLLDGLPADASPLQRDLARIVVEAFRDYPYTTGEGRLDFANARGEALLTLDGARGGRRLELHYQQDQPPVAEVHP